MSISLLSFLFRTVSLRGEQYLLAFQFRKYAIGKLAFLLLKVLIHDGNTNGSCIVVVVVDIAAMLPVLGGFFNLCDSKVFWHFLGACAAECPAIPGKVKQVYCYLLFVFSICSFLAPGPINSPSSPFLLTNSWKLHFHFNKVCLAI